METHVLVLSCKFSVSSYPGLPRLLSLPAFHTASDKSLGKPVYEAKFSACEQKHACLHVFSPFSAHLYSPLHHNGYFHSNG